MFINPGFSLINKWALGAFYLFMMFYIFTGIGIISDIFMEAIEVITSQTQIKEIKDS
jgi:hypothetical protein